MIKMNEECKYCSYLKQCPDVVEHNSVYCKCHKRIPKNRNISYEQLQNNWNELKNILKARIDACKYCDKNFLLSNSKKEIKCLESILGDMQELEQGKDE